MLLRAPTPAVFIATHLARQQARHDPDGSAGGEWRTMGDLLRDDAQAVRDAHARLVAAGTSDRAAAKYLAGWIGGLLGGVVGFTYATTGAGLHTDGTVRWRFHPGGWPDRVDVSRVGVVVPPGHRWAGLPGVESVRDPDVVRSRTVDALVQAIVGAIDVVHGLAKVGRNSLWAEVADGLGAATTSCPGLPDCADTIAPLEALLRVPDAPWRARPRLWRARGQTGPLVVARKGGCCLAYTCTVQGEPAGLDDDSDYGIFSRRFPQEAGEPSYCSTCRLRTPGDVEARQVFWTDLMAARTSPAAEDVPADR